MPTGRPGRGDGRRGDGVSRTRIVGEPDLATATLDDWRAWRRDLATLPQEDESVRIAIAVAEAQIAKLRRRISRG